MVKAITFGDIRPYFSRIDRVSICMKETLAYQNFIKTLSAEKIAEIHSLLDQSEKYLDEHGLEGMLTLEEFRIRMDKRMGRVPDA